MFNFGSCCVFYSLLSLSSMSTVAWKGFFDYVAYPRGDAKSNTGLE